MLRCGQPLLNTRSNNRGIACLSLSGASTPKALLYMPLRQRLVPPRRLCYPHECMAGVVLDGKKISQDILAELKPRVKEITKRRGRAPCLAVILVGDDPGSQIYVRNKIKAGQELGRRNLELKLPGHISTDEVFQAAG